MRCLTKSVEIAIGCLGLALLLGCEPTIKMQGQYVAGHDGTDLGLLITDLSSIPYAFDGQVAVFPPSVVFPTQTSIVPGLWLQANGITAGFPFGGGALPRSVTGSGLDIDADGVADQLEVVFVNDDATQFPMTLPRTDPYTDYRCWKGYPTCEAVAGPPSCAFTALGAERYDLHAEIPFRDEGNHMNPGGTLRVQIVDAVAPSYEAVGVPGSFTSGSTVYTTSAVGTTLGTITLDVTNLAVPGTATAVEFQLAVDWSLTYSPLLDYVACPVLP